MIKKTKEVKENYIVGIGASAGGLEAIHELFDNVPGNTDFSFVIVQHLSSDHKSLMGELLSKHTSMQIFEAKDNMKPEPNCVYLIPNKYMMTLEKGRLKLHEKLQDRSPNNAIDIFFESLANDAGEHAIAIILSGTGTDGTRGIEAIKNKGGVVVVQDPITAKFDGMPNSAVASGYADLIFSPDMIAEELLDFIQQAPLLRSFNEQHSKDEYVVTGILELLKTMTGYDFREYKKPTIFRRLAKRMSEVNSLNLQEYFTYLKNHSDEPKKLCREFLIGVTKFFRDLDAFEELKTTVLPELFKERGADNLLKVWVVACSTGEEAYTIAILLHDHIEVNKISGINVKIFATDIDSDAIDTASKGLYGESVAKDVPQELLEKYFAREGNNYRVAANIRKMVVFAHHNVLSDPPFSKIDLITCRNMLIYMSVPPQKHILKAFHFAVNREGYLFLGPSENIGILKDSFLEVNRKWKIYKCVIKSAQTTYSTLLNSIETVNYGKFSTTWKPKNALNTVPEIFNETLLETQNYAGIFIDKDFEVKQATGHFKNFLDFPEGNFNFNLIKLVHPELSTPLSVAIRKAIKDNDRVIVNNAKIDAGKHIRIINIIVKPYLVQREYLQPFIFIILHEQANVEKEKSSLSKQAMTTDIEKFSELEKELNDTRENMQALIEEVESANEELQTSNEEIISSNEELQSTNEELQSLNEELHTVNAEHQLKIKELIELNDDLNNYFRNSDIGQVIIDRKLIIRKFSPSATKQVNLIESDVGRSIIDISNNFKDLDFINSIKTVLKSGDILVKEVMMGNDTVFLMNLSPYLRLDKSIDGVVISFVDITEVKRLDGILNAVFNTSPSGITAKTVVRNEENKIIDFEYMMTNSAANKIMNREEGELVGKRMLEEFPYTKREHFDRYVNVVETGKPAQFEMQSDNGEWFEVVCVKMMDGIVTTSTDITESKQSADMLAKGYEELKTTSQKLQSTNEQLQISNMDLYQFASIASHDLKEPLRKIMAFGNILEDRIKNKINEQEKNYLEKIIKSSGRMQNLIEDVLTFSRLSNTEISLAETDLTNVVKTVIDDLEITIKYKKAKIKVGKLPVVYAVHAQMQQLFHNLISNALKFNESKVPSIEIEAVKLNGELKEKMGIDAKEYFAVRVKDNGIGFDAEYQEKIFKMFQRLNANYSGTGIGLAICKKIMENHKGIIFGESELNKGSVFTILLPKRS
ncbi:MAG: CheR family methyltransferase [Ferruginibacter sp.]